MALCVICLDTLKSPISLPCGHVYCHECILSKIESDVARSNVHRCPSCRNSYSITNVDPNAVPGHLRNSVLPALRRIYLDEIQGNPLPRGETEAEVSKLRSENAILRASCESWKRRASLHSALIYGVAKVAREQILSMRAEREQLEQSYRDLKHKHADLEASMSSLPTSTDDRVPRLRGQKRPRLDSGEPSDSEGSASSPAIPSKKLRLPTTSPRIKHEPTD